MASVADMWVYGLAEGTGGRHDVSASADGAVPRTAWAGCPLVQLGCRTRFRGLSSRAEPARIGDFTSVNC
ncbi:hypothetical protein PCAR4_740019 [Paraburkholderia caribensis]|nr:hypothetical protein PCAR4_740019 [Paraburkholderia caribensis]